MKLFGRRQEPLETIVASNGDNLVHISTEALIILRAAGEALALQTGRITAQQSGSYLSRFKGRGMEFDEARVYQPGDDVRSFDWRVTARTGVPHTKLFREERERAVLTWVDMRPTMFFATRGAFKSVVAARAAALVAWSANCQGDRLGGLVFTADTHHELRPKRGKGAVLQLLQQLSTASHWESHYNEAEPDAGNALARLRRVTKPGSLIFLFSDFRNLGPQAEAHLSELARHCDVVLCYIHDPLEAALPDNGLYRIAWGQRSALFGGDMRAREQYQQHHRQHLEQLQRLSRFPAVSLLACATNDDPVQTLQRNLGLRR
jgi:uncharacterized protein (DUF58 family)